MHLFLTGATGFVGHHLLRTLISKGHTVRCLVRKGSLDKLLFPEDRLAVLNERETDAQPTAEVEVVYGDVTDVTTFDEALVGCDAVIHLVGIIEEDPHRNVTFERLHVGATRAIVEATRAAGVPRLVHMSANGARADAPSDYHTTKWRAEEIVREAVFAGQIESAVLFRPSILFGDPGEDRPEFASQLLRQLIRPFPIVPVLGDGKYRLQPIAVEQVAEAFAEAVTMPLEAGEVRSYCAAGPEALTFDETLDRIAQGSGRKPRPKVHLPMPLARFMVNTLGRVRLLPISPAQFQMLVEGNTCDASDFVKDFGLDLIPFTPDNLAYLRPD